MFFMSVRKRALQFSLVALFLLCVGGSVVFGYGEYRSLSFSASAPSDFPFFMQFAARLLSPTLAHHFTINPNGSNMLTRIFHPGAGVADGAFGLASVHFEAMRYVTGFLYPVFSSPLCVDLLYASLAFLPLLYVVYLIARIPRAARGSVALSITALMLSPTALLLAATDTTRPATFLVGCLVLFGLAVIWERPLWERVLLLNLFLAVREEALILALPLIAFEFWRAYRSGSSYRTPGTLLAFWGAWLCAEAFYFWSWWRLYYTGGGSYLLPAETVASGVAHLHVVIVVGLVALLFTTLFIFLRRSEWWDSYAEDFVFAVLLSGIVLFSWIGVPAKLIPIPVFSQLFFFASAFVVLVFCKVARSRVLRQPRPTEEGMIGRIAMVAFALSIPASFAFVFWGSNSLPMRFASFEQKIPETQLVLRAHEKLSPLTPVLVDFDTYDAFYDFDNAYLYDRLPAYAASVPMRSYPQNKAPLIALLNTQVRYVVIAKKDENIINALAAQAGKHLVPIDENGQYGFYRLQ